MNAKSDFGAIRPDNMPRRRGRRDPDEVDQAPDIPTQPAPTPPAPAPAPQPAEPAPAPAAEPAPAPAAEPAPAPTRQATPQKEVARRRTTQGSGDLLASVLASKQPPPQTGQTGHTPDTSVSIQDMIKMRRKRVDPFNDYAADGTRMLRWIQETIAFTADLTGRTQQEVLRDALLGDVPLSEELLDQFFADRYGYPRPKDNGRR